MFGCNGDIAVLCVSSRPATETAFVFSRLNISQSKQSASQHHWRGKGAKRKPSVALARVKVNKDKETYYMLLQNGFP